MRIAKIYILFILTTFNFYALAQVSVTGELKKWHRVTLTFNGISTSETNSVNPFTDYRLNVTFTNGANTYVVPGFFAADGNAGESSSISGNKWRVHFCPSDTGTWTYTVSYRTGPYIAINDTPTAGVAVLPLNGTSGSFVIAPTDKTGKDFRGKGKLQYVNKHFLRFAETGEYFLKGSTNSPENLLAFWEFDGTYDADFGSEQTSSAPLIDGLHRFVPHVGDWNTGDPSWKSGKGKGIIGALNYLASEDMNSIYFVTLAVDADGDDVWPFTSHDPQDWERYDVSKLDQWEVVFSHADKLGINLHFVLCERENQTRLDDTGALGPQKKLYLRELIARFGHHLAINWNLGEENGHDYLTRGIMTTQDRKDMASYIKKVDPYKSYVNVHTWVNEWNAIYSPLLNYPDFDGVSLQIDKSIVHDEVITWLTSSAATSHKWVVNHDETVGGIDENGSGANHDVIRKKALWGSLMAGAAGFEVYFGGTSNDLNAEDYRTRSGMWEYVRYAKNFFNNYLPFWEMKNNNAITSTIGDLVLEQPGKVYAFYREFNIQIQPNLPCGKYTVNWYDPRNGGSLQNGTVTYVTGGGVVDIGSPPNNINNDWVALVKNDFSIGFSPTHVSCGVGNDGSIVITPSGGTTPYSYLWSNGRTTQNISQLTQGNYKVTVTDGAGCQNVDSVIILPDPRVFTYIPAAICNGKTYFAGGTPQNSPGIYYDTIIAVSGCDSIIVTTLSIKPNSANTVNVSICAGKSYFAGGSNRTTAGTYRDTLVSANGCDSVLTTNLTIKPNSANTVNVSICAGKSYFAGGSNRTTAGTYRDTLVSANGCDSVLTTNLTIKPNSANTVNVSICAGKSYFAGGSNRTTAGTYRDTLVSATGCDSVLTTNLTIKPNSANTVNVSICAGKSYFAGGSNRTTAGTYRDTLVSANGCDSVLTTNLTIKPNSANTVNASICAGKSYFAGGANRTTAGTYRDTLVSANGCDSVLTTNLTIKPNSANTVNVSICSGQSYFAGGSNRTTAGTYRDTLVSANGCDSVLTTNLTIKPNSANTVNVSICAGKSYFAGGSNRTTAGTYRDTLVSANGCDSVLTTNLTIKPNSVNTVNVSICSGQSYFAGGSNRTTAGTYRDTLVSANGCDSVLTTNLTIKPNSANTVNVSICSGQSYFAGGSNRTTAGTYRDTLVSANGCDSVLTTNLTIKPNSANTVNVSICSGQSYFAGGSNRTTAGTYRDTLVSANGCDSVLTTNLTIKPNSANTVNVSICSGQSYFAGGSNRTTAGTYRDTLISANGCDSVLTTNLTIKPNSANTVNVSICAGKSYFAGGANRTTAGTYRDTLVSANGCDSVLTTNLTVKPNSANTVNVSICAGKSYFAGGANRTTAGTYRDTLVSANGCDSVLTTNLTVKPNSTNTINVSICAGESYFVAGANRTTSGTYRDTLISANGCDSVITTNLTVKPNSFKAVNVGICDGQSYFAGGANQTTAGTYRDTLVSANGCDSVRVINLSVAPNILLNSSISACTGETVFIGGANQTLSGVYTDSFTATGGCDSIVITELTFIDPVTSTLDILIHTGNQYFAGGAYQTENGVYYDTLVSEYQCDSIVVTILSVENIVSDLTVNKIANTLTIRTTLEKSYADNTYGSNSVGWNISRTLDSLVSSDHLQWAFYDVNGIKKMDFVVDYLSYNSLIPSGYQSLGAQGGEGYVFEGSDSSIIHTTTSIDENFNTFGYVLPTASPITDTNYTTNPTYPNWIFDVWYEATISLDAFGSVGYGYHDIISVHASPDKDDSPVFIMSDTLIPPSCPRNETKNVILCQGDGYFAGGALQTVSGVYYDTLLIADTCEIRITSNVTVIPAQVRNEVVNICAGESYFAAGGIQTASGLYYDTLSTYNGCDSIIVTNLIVNQVYTNNIQVSICTGDSIFLGGNYRTTGGSYFDTLTSSAGCDSVIVTALIVNPNIQSNRIVELCNGEGIFAGGAFRTLPGVYRDTFTAQGGCDSVAVTTLQIYNHTTTNVTLQICNGESIFVAGALRTASGIYYDTLSTFKNCDSVIITQLTVLPTSASTLPVTICSNESYFAGGAPRNSTGQYFDTLAAFNGCDSVVITQLAVLPTKASAFPVTICGNETYFAGGAFRNSPGAYYDTLSATNGCDSVVATILTVLPTFASTTPATICQGDSILINGVYRKTAGTYRDTVTAVNGCDSMLTIILSLSSYQTNVIAVSICEGESYFVGGALQTTSGLYRDTVSVNGSCSVIQITALSVIPPVTKIFPVTICSNESYFAGGANRTTSGLYYDTLTRANGCDSILITSLTVLPSYNHNFNLSICLGDSIYLQGAYRSSAGIFRDTFTAVNGCDSLVTSNLIIGSQATFFRPVTICANESILAGGQQQSTTGIYYDTLASAGGCDSVIVTDLLVLPYSSANILTTICNGDSVFAHGVFRKTTGIYRDTLIGENGCDSILVTNLTVNPTFITHVSHAICEGDSIFAEGEYQTEDGIYYDTLTSISGCDSVIVTELIVDATIHINREIILCSGDSLFVGGAYQSISGFYYDTLMASGGCDSVVITDLEVIQGNGISINKNICAGDSVFLGGAYRKVNGIYFDTIQTSLGCDSFIVTFLSVKPNFNIANPVDICQGEKYWAGGNFQSVSGIYYDTLSSRFGCDSVIVTNLNVMQNALTNLQVSICQGESHFAQGAFRTATGNYFDTLISANGCDSVVITHLSVLPVYSVLYPKSICYGQSYFAGGALRTNPGIYYDTLSSISGCDSIVVTVLSILPPFTKVITASICANKFYFTGGGWTNTPGIYYDTLTAVSNGCDSVLITSLSVLPVFSTSRVKEICSGESFLAGGGLQTTSGLYYDTLTARNGCDSVITTSLIVRPNYLSTRQVSICNNESFFAGGAVQIAAGIYRDTLSTMFGCDSVIVTELTVRPTFSITVPVTICSNESYFAQGTLQNSSGFYFDTLTAANGCDSVVITDLTVLPTFSTTVPVTICDNESYFAQGNIQTTSGFYYDTLTSANGCDSVVITDLTVLPTFSTTVPVTICDNESHFAQGALQTTSGFYYDTLTSANGCDSVVITDLTVLPTFSTTVPVTICDNESHFAQGALQTTSGFYYDTLTAANGCNSVVITDLTVLSTFITAVPVTICDNESHFAQGALQTTSGFYYDTLTAANGCDSVVITDLTVLSTFSTTVPVTICDNESYFAQGAFQNASGFYYDTLTSANGCDSVVITDLTVLPTFSTTVPVTTCDNESYFAQGALQTTSGFYYDTLTAANGCDSIVITDLTVLSTFITAVPVTICDNESHFAQGALQNSSGFYYDTLTSANGCDSVVITDLTVLSTFITAVPVTICDNESHFAQGALQNASGFYYDTLTSSNGCDSVVITDLTVLSTFITAVPVTICDNESHFAQGALQNSSGFYFDTLAAANGCDSTVITDLTVLPTFITTVPVTICDNESYFAQGALQNSSGFYFDTLAAANGCDSVVITDLTVLSTFITAVPVTICDNESYFAQGALQNSSGFYFDTLAAANGCDSTVITDLTVLPTFITTVPVTICDNESYFAQGALQNSSGFYFDTLAAANGCDSTVITDLTVLPTFITTVPVTICDNESHFAQGVLQTMSGFYFDTLAAANGCDSIIVTELTVLPTFITTVQVAICDNQFYFAQGAFQNSAGLYYDTLAASNGCDSIVVTDLTVLHTYISFTPVTICNGESYFAGGALQTSAGIYTDTLAALSWCDSIAVTILSVNPTFATTVAATICSNESYFVQGTDQNTSGTYYDTLVAMNGCDSIITTELTVLPSSVLNIPVVICDNESYFAQGAIRSSSGLYYDTLIAANGCDSILITQLTVLPTASSTFAVTICGDNDYWTGGALQTTSGIYVDTLTADNGCDSLVITELTVFPVFTTTISISICDNENYFVQGASQTSSGIYFDTLASLNGCDSVIITDLTVLPTFITTIPVTVCNNDSYFAGGALQTTSGNYYDTLTTTSGCDSVVVTELSVVPAFTTTLHVTICANESHFAAGTLQTTSGNYYDTLTSANGCDSIVVTELTVLPSFITTILVNICDNESHFAAGALQTVSGNYYDTLVALNGCDSIVITGLTVLPTFITTVSITICDNENYFAGGSLQNTPGSYYDTLTGANGCDSIVVTGLTVLPTFITTIPVTICDNDSYTAGGTLQTTSGIYYDTLAARTGCDSIIVTDLTVLPTFMTNVPVTICDNENYLAGGALQNSSGIYIDKLTASNGCDSVVVTNLNVLPTFTTSITITICDDENYFAGGALQNSSGVYYDTLTAFNGCDSIVITDLTVHPTFVSPVAVTICDNESYIAGGALQTTAGTYYDTLSTLNGCDSVVITNLSVLPAFVFSAPATICANESYFVQGAFQTAAGTYYDTLIAQNGCDSLIITNLFVEPVYLDSVNAAICDRDSIYLQGAFRKISGFYRDTLTASNGCDSILVTNLSVEHVLASLFPVTICQGEVYYAQGAPRSLPGLYYDTISTQGRLCDSVIITALSVIPSSVAIQTVQICPGDFYFAGGGIQTETGLYYDTLYSFFGCDSIIVTDLRLKQIFTTNHAVEICANENYFVQGAWRNTAGIYQDNYIAANGCDSLVITTLTVSPVYNFPVSVIICTGESYSAGRGLQTVSGIYYDTLQTIQGCDSTIITTLNVLPSSNTNIPVTICANESYFAQGALRNTTGNYYDTLTSMNGCDSIITTSLNVNPTYSRNFAATICQGETYLAGGIFQNSSGIYYDTLASRFGCDSIIATNLTVLPVYSVNRNISICDNENIFLQGALRNTSGIYIDTLIASNGCDSIVNTNLAVLPTFTTNLTFNICSGDSIYAGGKYRKSNGVYFDTLATQNGCDSILVSSVSVSSTILVNTSQSICLGDSIFFGGAFRKTSGSYSGNYTTISGCDSTVTLQLTVLVAPNANAGADATICSGLFAQLFASGGAFYLWSNGATTNFISVSPTVNTEYRVTVSNSIGCSDVDTVQVFIKPSPVVNFVGVNATYCTNSLVVALAGNPAGGTFSGPGVSGSNFNPAGVAVGTHTITYRFTDSTGCTGTANHTINISPSPVASFTGLNNYYCFANGSYPLTGTPAGGVFSGMGIAASEFNPVNAGVGNHQVTYTIISATTGCTATATKAVEVKSLPVLNFVLNDDKICIDESPITLTASPAGGTFSGTGIGNSTFNPSTAGFGGPYTLTYAYTDGAGCSNSATQQITVYSQPSLSIVGVAPYYCVNEDSIKLNGSPTGGYFTGPGVVNSCIYPDSVGIGNHQVTYIYSDNNGCSAFTTIMIPIRAVPYVELAGLDSVYCSYDPVTIITGTPPGGSFSGPGIMLNTFEPLKAGAGESHLVIYNYTASNGCKNSDTAVVKINPIPVLTIENLDSVYCTYHPPVTLIGTPSGGVFVGSGVSDGKFSPRIAGPGNHVVIYSYTDENDCDGYAKFTFKVSGCTGIDGKDLVDEISVYPNPFEEVIMIEIESKRESNFNFSIKDVLGRVIYSEKKMLAAGKNTIRLHPQELISDGVYFLEVRSKENRHTYKLTKL